MSISIPSDTPTSPDWLSLLLRQSGALQHGSVQAVEAGTSAAFNSHVHYLRLHYSSACATTIARHATGLSHRQTGLPSSLTKGAARVCGNVLFDNDADIAPIAAQPYRQ